LPITLKCAVSDFYVGALAKLTPPKHFQKCTIFNKNVGRIVGIDSSIASFDYVTVYAIIHGVAKEDSI
jgi:hypothetical protein